MSKPKNSTKVTPPNAGPVNAAPDELSDEQLDQVAGGAMAYSPAPVVSTDITGALDQTGSSASSGGAGTGKATFSSFTITKTTDKSSPVL
jgi:hypothetical protein